MELKNAVAFVCSGAETGDEGSAAVVDNIAPLVASRSRAVAMQPIACLSAAGSKADGSSAANARYNAGETQVRSSSRTETGAGPAAVLTAIDGTLNPGTGGAAGMGHG